MKKPKKPPVKAKGGGGGGSGAGTGKRGVGPGKSRGIKPHHPIHHRAGFKGAGTAGGSGGGSGGPVSHKKPKPPKKRAWSPGWDAECCVAEAVGRILGLSDSQVLELDAAGDRTIPGVLEVAGPVRGLILGVALPQSHAIAVIDGVWWSWGEPFDPDEWPQLVIEETWLCAG